MVERGSARRRGPLSFEILLFALLVVLHLIPLWAFPFFPSQDGPAHQETARILREYAEPGAGLIREYYHLNRGTLPNWFTFFLLTKVFAFLPVPVAEKVLLSLYVVLLPVSVRFALRSIDPRAAPWSILAFPFLYNFLFHAGFYNFCFSLVAFFFTVGFWMRHAGRLGPWRVAALGLLVLWLYFCHPVSLVLALAVILTLASWRVFLDLRRGMPVLRGARRWLPGPALAFLPALVLLVSFVGKRMHEAVAVLPLEVKVRHLVSLFSLVSVDRRLVLLSCALSALFGVLTARFLAQRLRRRGLEAADGLLLASGVCAAAYFLAPSTLSGGGFINQRINLFPFLLLILWFGTCELSPRGRRAIQAAAACLCLGILGLLWPRYAELNDYLAEYVSAGEHIAPDATVLSLSYAHEGVGPGGRLAFRMAPFLHATGHIAARHRIVDLSHYQADEDYFPIYFDPALNPYRKIGRSRLALEGRPPQVDFLTYAQRTRGRVDYVLLWELKAVRQDDPQVRSVLQQLAAGYEPVYTSPRGLVRLWRRRGATLVASALPVS